MLERYIYILNIALDAVFLNKFRSILTALGIIFGVAAVIAMMAIGNGAKKEILDQMKLVGVNNILIEPKTTKVGNSGESSQNSGSTESGKKAPQKFSPGLTISDAEAITKIIPTVSKVCPEVIFQADVINQGVKSTATLTGVTPDFFDIFNLEMQEGGMFSEEQLREGKAVCIIGPSIQSRFFPGGNPIGQEIKCGSIWLQVIGVLKKHEVSQTAINDLGISDYNNGIYAPVQTLLRRYKDRALITEASLHGNISYIGGGMAVTISDDNERGKGRNQIDKIVVQVKESEQIKPTTAILQKLMARRHEGVDDFEIKVPELLLKQQQRAKDIFNIVLGAIAGISLLVGGIGIMNIMLASVMERIKEIGIRQAMGATKRDIILQFLTEATLLSITGGIIGVLLGIALSLVIMKLAGILTIISAVSIIISFVVSASVGIIFGFTPARRAARQDPVESLRYE